MRFDQSLPLVLLALTSCAQSDAFCCGYSLDYQGGSKVSLIHAGLVVESYTVTGVLHQGHLTAFEVRPYGAVECRYRVATLPDRLSRPLTINELNETHSGLATSIRGRSFRALSSLSCMPDSS